MTAWNDRYINNDTPWDQGAASPAFLKWFKTAKACRVLVPGCGRGYEVEALSQGGFDVTALDISPEPLRALQGRLEGRNLEAKLVQADVLTWLPETPVDVVFEQTCLCALEPEHWNTYAQQLYRWLKPGGVLQAAFMQTGRDGGPPFDCPIETMRDYFSNEQWKWPDSEPERFDRPNRDIFELLVPLTKI